MAELEIDPGDASRMLLASDRTMFRSTDGGDRWRPLEAGLRTVTRAAAALGPGAATRA